MKADREKRAMILTAEGQRESAIRSAEGRSRARSSRPRARKQAAILNAEADRQSRILRAQGERAAQYLQAQGEAKAIEKVFAAIKSGRPTPELLAYQYLQTLPQMAQGDANKVWIVPSDFGKALEGFTKMLGAPGGDGVFRFEPSPVDDVAVGPAGGRRRGDQGLVRHVVGSGDRPRRGGRAGAGPRRDPAVVTHPARPRCPRRRGRVRCPRARRRSCRPGRRSGGAARRGQPPRAGAARAG